VRITVPGEWMRRSGVVFLTIAIIMMAGYAIPSLLEEPASTPGQRHASPHEVIERFLKAVDRGELTLFLYTLNRAILIPRRVEYVYELDDPTPTVTVYCELKEAVPVPGQPNLVVQAITAVLGYDGSIVETRAHIFNIEAGQTTNGE
jgi:hypothetical protein